MALSERILKRVVQLGGAHGVADLEMEAAIRGLNFPAPLLGGDEVDDAISQEDATLWLTVEPEQFFKSIPRGFKPFFFRTFENHYFKPFTEGSSDQGAWGDLNEEYFRQQVTGPTLGFIEIGCWEGGYPDLFYVCLSDPDPSNPQVYATDSDCSWETIKQEGQLLAFLDRFQTPSQLRATLQRITVN